MYKHIVLMALLLMPPQARVSTSCDTIECTVVVGDISSLRAFLRAGADPAQIIVQPGRPPGNLLMHAVEYGREAMVLELLEAGADPYRPDMDFSLLHLAAARGMVDVVKYIITRWPDLIDAPQHDSNDRTALSVAAATRRIDILRLLIKNGADVSRAGSNRYGDPLTVAMLGRHEGVARLLLEAAKPEAPAITPDTIAMASGFSSASLVAELVRIEPEMAAGHSPTILSAAWGNCRHQERVLSLLFQSGVNPCARVEGLNGTLTLFELAEKGFQDGGFYVSAASARTLAAHVTSCNAGFESAEDFLSALTLSTDCETLDCALTYNDREFVRKWTAKNQHEFTIEHVERALISDSQESAIALLSTNPSLLCAERYPWSALHRALVLGKYRVVNHIVDSQWESLLQQCGSILRVNPLTRAALVGDVRPFQQIETSGELSNLYREDSLGFVPLMFSLAMGNDDIAQILVENGADLLVRTKSGHTLLHFATLGEAVALMPEQLVSAGVDPNATDSVDGRNAAHIYASTECPSLYIKHLEQVGVDFCAHDRYERSAYEYMKQPRSRMNKAALAARFLDLIPPEDSACSPGDG